MIPDFISAIYLLVADKISGPYPAWRSWLVPACLFILFVAISVLFIKANESPKGEPTSFIELSTTVEEVVEIENLKARLTAAEANILAVIEVVNRVAVAIENIKPPPSLGNLATTGELELLRFEVKALEKELTRVSFIYGHYSETFDLKLEEMRLSIEELEEALTAHTDNTTIHN